MQKKRKHISFLTMNQHIKTKTAFNKRRFFIKLTAASLFLTVLNISVWIFIGLTDPNEPKRRDFPVRGCVCSADNGKADLRVLSSHGVDFIYIRATAGTNMTDSEFDSTSKTIPLSAVPVGAIHRLSYGVNGSAQAEHFYKKTKEKGLTLIPAVDITKYGIYRFLPCREEKIKSALDEFCRRIYELSGQMPLVICDKAIYEKYLSGSDKYKVWLISSNGEPNENINYTVWQYTNKRKAEGVQNKDSRLGGAVLNNRLKIDDIYAK